MLDLKRYVPNGRVSSGMVIRYDGGLAWGVAKRKYWRTEADGLHIPLIGIGGGQEPGETLMETLQREAREEANTGVVVRDVPSLRGVSGVRGAASTLWVHADGRVERRDLAAELAPGEAAPGEVMPGLIWQTVIQLRTDDGRPYNVDYINPVYSATFTGEPWPGDGMPALLVIPVEAFLGLLDGPEPLAVLLGGAGAAPGEAAPAGTGAARLIGEALPDDALIELQGSALYVARHWAQVDWP